jgi:hypothetical protein
METKRNRESDLGHILRDFVVCRDGLEWATGSH